MAERYVPEERHLKLCWMQPPAQRPRCRWNARNAMQYQDQSKLAAHQSLLQIPGL